MGINYRDNPDSGRSTAKRWGIPFPSLDDPAGLTILALQGKVTSPPDDARARPHRTDRRPGQRRGDGVDAHGLVDDVLAEQ